VDYTSAKASSSAEADSSSKMAGLKADFSAKAADPRRIPQPRWQVSRRILPLRWLILRRIPQPRWRVPMADSRVMVADTKEISCSRRIP
jgi:hypothetical protein